MMSAIAYPVPSASQGFFRFQRIRAPPIAPAVPGPAYPARPGEPAAPSLSDCFWELSEVSAFSQLTLVLFADPRWTAAVADSLPSVGGSHRLAGLSPPVNRGSAALRLALQLHQPRHILFEAGFGQQQELQRAARSHPASRWSSDPAFSLSVSPSAFCIARRLFLQCRQLRR